MMQDALRGYKVGVEIFGLGLLAYDSRVSTDALELEGSEPRRLPVTGGA